MDMISLGHDMNAMEMQLEKLQFIMATVKGGCGAATFNYLMVTLAENPGRQWHIAPHTHADGTSGGMPMPKIKGYCVNTLSKAKAHIQAMGTLLADFTGKDVGSAVFRLGRFNADGTPYYGKSPDEERAGLEERRPDPSVN